MLQEENHFRVSEIRDNSGHETTFVGAVDGEVIGKVSFYIDKEKNEAEYRIHLRKEWQGKGYGYLLSKSALERVSFTRIWLGFEEGNEPARKLYEKLGFKYTVHRMEIK